MGLFGWILLGSMVGMGMSKLLAPKLSAPKPTPPPPMPTEDLSDAGRLAKKRMLLRGGREATLLTSGWLKEPLIGKTRLGE